MICGYSPEHLIPRNISENGINVRYKMGFSFFVVVSGITLGDQITHIVPSLYFYTFTSSQFVTFMNFLTIPHTVPALHYTSLKYICLLSLNCHIIGNLIKPNTIKDIAHSHISQNL